MIRQHWMLTLCSLLLFPVIIIGLHLEASAQDIDETVRVGVFENKPLVFTNSNGEVDGYYIDILEYIAEEEGWNLFYVPGTWPECLERLREGEIDLQVGIARTEERSEYCDFNDEIVLTNWSIVYVREDSEIQSLTDLEGKSIALLDSDVNTPYMLELLDSFGIAAEIHLVDEFLTVLDQVSSGASDSGAVHRVFGLQHAGEYDLHATPIIYSPYSVRYAGPIDQSKDLLNAIDSHLVIMKETPGSVFYLALEKWLGGETIKAYHIPKWLQYGFVALLILAVFFLLLSNILRTQVKKKTSELIRSNLELQDEILLRKNTEERNEHLNLVLRAIRNVNQLIVKEKDRNKLIKGACENLIENRGYFSAWIALLDESGNLTGSAEAGLGDDFQLLLDRFKRDELMHCARETLNQPGFLVFDDKQSTCGDCPLVNKYLDRTVATVRLEYEGKVYGLLSVSVPAHVAGDKEEQSLFIEVAEDISFALHAMELEEKRKKADEEIRKFKTIADIANYGVAIADIKGNIIYVNETWAEMHGHKPEDEIGCHLSVLHSEDELDRVNELNQRIMDEGGFIGEEVMHLRNDGTEFPMLMTSSNIKDEKGNPICLAASGIDITDRKLAREEIEEKNRELEKALKVQREFLSMVSHELRTPLVPIIGYSDLLLDETFGSLPEEAIEPVQVIKHRAQDLTNLIEDLLIVSSFDRDKMRFQIEPVSIFSHVNELIADFQSVDHVKDVTIEWIGKDFKVLADPVRLKQIIRNLLDNSIKYSGDSVEIVINSRIEGDKGVISVTDNGIGIPEKDLPQVFERFYQAEGIDTREHGGVGLGLAITKELVELMGGTIEVESEPGEGSVFTFTLPIAN